MTKRALCLLLAVVTLFSLSVPAFAEEAPVTRPEEVTEEAVEPVKAAATSGTCGDNLKWSRSGGTLTISGTGKMWDYDYEHDDLPIWYNYRDSIQTVVIKSGVTSIGDYAFAGCYALTRVDVPASVTSLGGGAFRDCAGLESVTIPDGVASIEHDIFYNCLALKGVTIPSSVTSIGERAFMFCPKLTSVNIPDGVISIGNAAFDCSGLTSVKIPDGVKNIGGSTFLLCEDLTSITIPDSVTSIGDGAFDCCFSLKDVYYGGSKTQWNAISIEGNNDALREAAIHYNSAPAPTKLAAPTVKISKVAESIKNTWNKISGAPRYMVYYRENGGSWKKIGTTTATTYTRKIADLKNGVTYQFTVRCCANDKKTLLGPYKASNSLKYTMPKLAAPTVKIAKASDGIKVTWNKVTGSSRYMVYYKEGNGSWKKIGTTTSTTYTRAAKYLKNGVKYTFTVRCCANDKKTLLGPYKASNSLTYKSSTTQTFKEGVYLTSKDDLFELFLITSLSANSITFVTNTYPGDYYASYTVALQNNRGTFKTTGGSNGTVELKSNGSIVVSYSGGYGTPQTVTYSYYYGSSEKYWNDFHTKRIIGDSQTVWTAGWDPRQSATNLKFYEDGTVDWWRTSYGSVRESATYKWSMDSGIIYIDGDAYDFTTSITSLDLDARGNYALDLSGSYSYIYDVAPLR